MDRLWLVEANCSVADLTFFLNGILLASSGSLSGAHLLIGVRRALHIVDSPVNPLLWTADCPQPVVVIICDMLSCKRLRLWRDETIC